MLLTADPVEVLAFPPRDVPFEETVSIGDRFVFARSDRESGTEIWASDGTAPGTQLLKDIIPGPSGSVPRDLTVVGDEVFFFARDEQLTRLWRSDGTPEGTFSVTEFNAGRTSSNRGIDHTNNGVLFRDNDSRLYFQPVSVDASPIELSGQFNPESRVRTVVAGKQYFLFEEDFGTASSSERIWISDGTIERTHVVMNPPSTSLHSITSVRDTDAGLVIGSKSGYHEISIDGHVRQLTDPDELFDVDSKLTTENADFFTARSYLQPGTFIWMLGKEGVLTKLQEVGLGHRAKRFGQLGDQIAFAWADMRNSDQDGYALARIEWSALVASRSPRMAHNSERGW